MGLKIAVVGGGSTYTPELVEGFASRAARLPVDELVLLDVDAERLGIVAGLAGRILARRGWSGRLTPTTDRAAALDGADFVVIQLRVGGQAARFRDETIPPRFGCVGQETTGPGGFAKALRTVPVVLEIAEEAARRANPGAWLVNFTNPVGIVTQALLDDGHHALGLCNVAIGFQRRFARHFGVDPDRLALEHVGLNHLSWERALRVDDVDRLLRAGADKVGVNTAAISRPGLIADIADRFGSQVLVLSADVRRRRDSAGVVTSEFEVTTHGGRRRTGLDAIAWCARAAELGAGEILLNSMDADGTKDGFDLELIQAVRREVSVPLVASGGAGAVSDFAPAVDAGADAVLAASVFHFGELTIGQVKAALASHGLPVR